jgi:hypothetical protein
LDAKEVLANGGLPSVLLENIQYQLVKNWIGNKLL